MFRRFFMRLGEGFRRFMYGRYGTDRFNLFLTICAVAVSIAGSILSFFANRTGSAACAVVSIALMLLSYLLILYAVFRMLSRKLDKRGAENRRYMKLTVALRDREHRYFRCPKCRQSVRVPRGRGKIRIRCPRCSEQFVKKT